MLFFHGFDSIEYLEKRLLKDFGVSGGKILALIPGEGNTRSTHSIALWRLGSSSLDLDYSVSDSWPAHHPHRTPHPPLPAQLWGVLWGL
jgi:hypothetical protein